MGANKKFTQILKVEGFVVTVGVNEKNIQSMKKGGMDIGIFAEKTIYHNLHIQNLFREKILITEQPNFNLSLLADNFKVCDDYTKEVILSELQYWQQHVDFLVLISTNDDDSIDGFLIGYRHRNSLWLAQIWRKAGSDTETSNKAFGMAKDWAKKKGMTSMTGETQRDEMKAMERYGFKEYSIIMRYEL